MSDSPAVIARVKGIALTCEMPAPDPRRDDHFISFDAGCLADAKRYRLPAGGIRFSDGHGGPRLGVVTELATVAVSGSRHVVEIMSATLEDTPRAREILRRLARYLPLGRTMGLSIAGAWRPRSVPPTGPRRPALTVVASVDCVEVSLATTRAEGNVPGTQVLGIEFPPDDGWDAAPRDPRALPPPGPREIRLAGRVLPWSRWGAGA